MPGDQNRREPCPPPGRGRSATIPVHEFTERTGGQTPSCPQSFNIIKHINVTSRLINVNTSINANEYNLIINIVLI